MMEARFSVLWHLCWTLLIDQGLFEIHSISGAGSVIGCFYTDRCFLFFLWLSGSSLGSNQHALDTGAVSLPLNPTIYIMKIL
jgi:hypothetical protein